MDNGSDWDVPPHPLCARLAPSSEDVRWWAGLLLFLAALGLAYSEALERGWSFSEALYFLWISATTIGLGDYGPSNNSMVITAVVRHRTRHCLRPLPSRLTLLLSSPQSTPVGISLAAHLIGYLCRAVDEALSAAVAFHGFPPDSPALASRVAACCVGSRSMDAMRSRADEAQKVAHARAAEAFQVVGERAQTPISPARGEGGGEGGGEERGEEAHSKGSEGDSIDDDDDPFAVAAALEEGLFLGLTGGWEAIGSSTDHAPPPM